MPYIILGVLLHHAPNGLAQAKMVEVYHQQYLNVIAAYEDNPAVQFEKVLVGMLYDGLNINVWPWDEPKRDGDDRSLAGWNDIIQKSAEQARTGTWGPWGEKGREGV